MAGYAFLNGKMVRESEGGVPLSDIGFLRGYGAFEVIRTFNGAPFLISEHLLRLENSARVLDIKLPHSRGEIAEIINELIAKNNYKESTIRVVLTGGPIVDSVEYNRETPTFLILAHKLPVLPRSYYEEGVKLITTKYKRILPGIKNLNYLVAAQMRPEVKKAGAVELLYAWEGRVLEGTTSNFFIVKGNTVITPKEDVLPGTTRKLVLDLASYEHNIKEREVLWEELAKADEAFVTSTNKSILPVVRVDDRIIGKGVVGPVTKKLMRRFSDYAGAYAALRSFSRLPGVPID